MRFHSTFSNLSLPDRPNLVLISACSSERTLMQKEPMFRMICQVVDDLPGLSIINFGSRDSDENDWQVNPTGRPESSAVTTTIPLQNRPRTLRNRLVSSSVGVSMGLDTVQSVTFLQTVRRGRFEFWFGHAWSRLVTRYRTSGLSADSVEVRLDTIIGQGLCLPGDTLAFILSRKSQNSAGVEIFK